jgi:hypothetical protein
VRDAGIVPEVVGIDKLVDEVEPLVVPDLFIPVVKERLAFFG